MSQPLVPLWRHFNVAVEGERAVLHDAPHALLLRGERVAELPEGVAVQVLAWEGGQLGGGEGSREGVCRGEEDTHRRETSSAMAGGALSTGTKPGVEVMWCWKACPRIVCRLAGLRFDDAGSGKVR